MGFEELAPKMLAFWRYWDFPFSRSKDSQKSIVLKWVEELQNIPELSVKARREHYPYAFIRHCQTGSFGQRDVSQL